MAGTEGYRTMKIHIPFKGRIAKPLKLKLAKPLEKKVAPGGSTGFAC